MNFDTLFVNPSGRTARNQFIGALITLLVAFGFYYFLVPGRNSQWVQLVFLYPAIVLLARRLHDMGRAAWPLLVPAALVLAMAWLYLYRSRVAGEGQREAGGDRRVGRLHRLGPHRQEPGRAESIRESRGPEALEVAIDSPKARGARVASP